MKQIIEMGQFKTTLNTVVYKAGIYGRIDKVPFVKSIYLTKSMLSVPYPENITVTVETK